MNGVAAAVGNIINDYEFASKIYAQAGLAIRLEATENLVSATTTSPFTDAELDTIAASARSANADTINNYYVAEYDPATKNGTTLAPNAQRGSDQLNRS